MFTRLNYYKKSIHVFHLGVELFHAFWDVSIWKLVECLLSGFWNSINVIVVMISSDSSGELHVFLHDGGSLGVDGAEVGVLEDTDEISLRCFLKGYESLSLESEVLIDRSANVSHKSVEWSSWEKHVGGFLISLDLSKSDGTCSVSHLFSFTLGFLDSTLGWSSLLADDLGFGTNLFGDVLCFWHFLFFNF